MKVVLCIPAQCLNDSALRGKALQRLSTSCTGISCQTSCDASASTSFTIHKMRKPFVKLAYAEICSIGFNSVQQAVLSETTEYQLRVIEPLACNFGGIIELHCMNIGLGFDSTSHGSREAGLKISTYFSKSISFFTHGLYICQCASIATPLDHHRYFTRCAV